MAKTLLEFAAECSSFPARYKAEQKASLILSSKAVQAAEMVAARQARWPTTKKRPGGLGPIGLTTRLLNDNSAEVRGRGGAAYAYEYGADKHVIQPRKAKAVHAGPYGWKAYVEHPGFKGRKFWQRGATLASPTVVKAMEYGVVAAMRKTFG